MEVPNTELIPPITPPGWFTTVPPPIAGKMDVLPTITAGELDVLLNIVPAFVRVPDPLMLYATGPATSVAPATTVPVGPFKICGVVHRPGVVRFPSPEAQSAHPDAELNTATAKETKIKLLRLFTLVYISNCGAKI